MRKKMLLVVSLFALAMFAFAACGGGGTPEPAPAIDAPAQPAPPAPAPTPTVDPAEDAPIPEGTRADILARIAEREWPVSGAIVFGTSTPTSANIMSAAWDNPAPNAQARDLMWGGLSTMERNHNNEFFQNPMVMVDNQMPVRTINADGSLTLHFHIYTDNVFSDGTQITAHHYAGAIAFWTSPQWAMLVPSVTTMIELENRAAWLSGESPTATFARIYDDANFSLTFSADFIPFVWESPLFNSVGPFPLHAIGVEAHDDGQGVFLTGPNRSVLTNEAVELAINGGEPIWNEAGTAMIGGDGFRWNPHVVVGPYMWGGRDAASGQLRVVANPLFPGTWDGFKPRIEEVYWRVTPTPQLVDALVTGEIDLVVGQGTGSIINQMLDRAVGGGTHTFESYTRNGYGFISFHVDHGASQFRSVRQAIQWLIDRVEFAELFTEGHGVVNHGPYGTAQWWVIDAYDRGFLDRIIWYTQDLDRAIQILEADGWIYDRDGNPFVGPGTWGPTLSVGDSNIRHKMHEGELMPLHIHWCTFASPNPITAIIDILLPEPLEHAGILLTDHRTDDALSHRSRAIHGIDHQEFNMFNLGVTFATTWNPWLNYDPNLFGTQNPNFVDDAELLALAMPMRFMSHVTEEGRAEWVDAWMDLMVYLNEFVIDIPLYVDIWFDFIPHFLHDWANTSVWGFPMAIQRAYIAN